MHGALPADNIFLLALLLYNLSPCQAKNEEDNPVKNFFTDMNTAITSVIASKFNVAMRLLQQDFTKYFRAVLARWTQDLSVRTNEARFDNLDNFSDQEILAHAYKIANMSKATSNSSSTTSERPSDAKEAEPLEDVDEEIMKIPSVDEEEDTWDANLAVNDGSENSVNGDFDSGDDSANEFEEPDGEEPEIRVVDSAISLIDSESNAKNSDTESTIHSRDQVDSDIMNHSRDEVDSDIMNLASQLARLNGTTRVSQDGLLDVSGDDRSNGSVVSLRSEANAIVDEERFTTLNVLNVTSSNASTGTDTYVNDMHMTRPGLAVLISKSLKLPSEIINNEDNKKVSDTASDAVNVTFTRVTAIDERYRNVTGFVLNGHSSAPENTSLEINIEHKHVASAPHSSIAGNMLHEINIDGKSMNMTNITFDANNLTTTDAGLNMNDKPKHVISSISMSPPSSLVSKSGAALTNITSMKITQTGDNSATGAIIASNFGSVPIASATFSAPTTEVNLGRSRTKLASESNFNEKKMPAPWPKATPSNIASKGNGSERRGFADLMIFDAADPALDEEQPLSPPFMKKDIIIMHTLDLNARPPEPIKMTAEEHKLLRVKTPSESNINGFLNSQIDRLATPSSAYTKPPSKLRQKRDISNSPSGNNPRFPLLCALKSRFSVFIDVSRPCDKNTAIEFDSSDSKYFPKYANQHPIVGVGRHSAPNSIARLFNTRSARFSRYGENSINDRLKYIQHRKLLGKRPRQKRAAVHLNHKEAASSEAYFPIWIGHRFSTSITNFPHHNQSVYPDKPDFSRHSRLPHYKQPLSPDKPKFSRYHSRFPPYTQSMFPDKPEFSRHHPRFLHYEESMSPDKLEFLRYHPRFLPYTQSVSPDKPEFSRHHPRFPHYKQSVYPDKPEFPRHHPRSKKRQRIKRAAFDALMSMIANKWAKSNNDEAEETLHTDRTDPELDSQESVEQSSQMGPPVEYSSLYLPREPHVSDSEPGSHSREAFNFVKQGTRFRANEVEHPFLSLLRQYSQGTSKSSHFDVIAHELHSKISELCASFHAAWLHTLTASTESVKPSTATTEKPKSVLTSVAKSRPSQLTDRRPKRRYTDERTITSVDDQITYESNTQPELSPSYRERFSDGKKEAGSSTYDIDGGQRLNATRENNINLKLSRINPVRSLENIEEASFEESLIQKYGQLDKFPDLKPSRVEKHMFSSASSRSVNLNLPSKVRRIIFAKFDSPQTKKEFKHPQNTVLGAEKSSDTIVKNDRIKRVYPKYPPTFSSSSSRLVDLNVPSNVGRMIFESKLDSTKIESKNSQSTHLVAEKSSGIFVKNDRIKRAYPEYPPLSAAGKEITKSKTSVSISPTRKHIMRLERKSGLALDASSPSKPQNLIKSIENFKKLAKLDLEQLENIDLEDGFAIDELDADALVSPSQSEPTEDLVEIHALPSITEATPLTRGNAKSTNVNSSNVKSSIVKCSNVKSTNVKSSNVKSTDVMSPDVKSTNVISTNVEITNVTLRTYSQSSTDSYSRINTTTENLAGELGICQPCQSTPPPSEVKMGFSDEDLALTSTSPIDGLERGFEESYPTFPTPPHSFDNLSSPALQNELESAVEGVKPTDNTLSSSGREAGFLELYPPRFTATDEVESGKMINYPNPTESSDEIEETTESKRKVSLSQVDSHDSRPGIHSNGTDGTELVEEIDVFKPVNTQGLSEFPGNETLPTFPVQSSRERTESPDDEPLTTFPGKINEGPPDYQMATGSPHFKTPSPVLISPVNSVSILEAEQLVSPAFRLISSGSPVKPFNTNVITEPLEILSNAKSSDIAEDDMSWKSIGVREPDLSEDGIGVFPTPPSDLVEEDISRKSIGVRGPDISEDKIGVFPIPPSLPDAAPRPFIHASNQDTNSQINQSNKLTLKKYYQTHPTDKLKSAEVTERMFYTRNPPTWRGHDPSTVYPTPEIIPPFTQRPITKSVPTVVSSTIQDATGDLRRILWQPFLFEDTRNDVNHRRTRFYNRSNRPQSRLYVKEDRISKEVATDPAASGGGVIAGSSIEAAKPEIEEFVRLSTRPKHRKRLPKVRTTSEASFYIIRNS